MVTTRDSVGAEVEIGGNWLNSEFLLSFNTGEITSPCGGQALQSLGA